MAIEDFGKKIGGARKDLWKSRGLQIEDIEDFNTAERTKYITKDNIWPKLNYVKMLNEEGYQRDALFFIKSVRDAIPAKPELSYADTNEEIQEKQEAYIQFINEFKKELLSVKTKEDIDKLGIGYLVTRGDVVAPTTRWGRYEVNPVSRAFVTNKFFKALQLSASEVYREANRKLFLATEVKGLAAQFTVLNITGNFKIEKYPDKEYVRDEKGLVQRDENGQPMQRDIQKARVVRQGMSSTSYFYAKDSTVNEALLILDDIGFKYVGNCFILNPEGRIIGMAENQQEAVQYIEKLAAKQFEKEEPEKEKEKPAEKAESNRKKTLVPPILAHVHRIGPDAHIQDVTGQDFIDIFKIPGGEFGNWLNTNERQTNLNMAFDSFKDIAKALNINDSDISLNGKLSIAFGSRGVKGAAAHYEPMREVINLTKMKGAGSLAHEFFHAMDDIAGKNMRLDGFATAKEYARNANGERTAFAELVRAMKYKEVTLSVDDLNKELDAKCEKQVNKFKQELIKMVPDSALTPELIEERDKLIDDIVAKAKDPDIAFKDMEFGRRGQIKYTIKEDVIKDICNFIDSNSKFYKMNKHNKEWLCQEAERVKSAYVSERATKPETRMVETDFYKNSKKMDDCWAKTNNGYWHSNVEMAARAFACYLHDKMKEMGIRNDYLTGHAFQSGMSSNSEVIPVYPEKGEREVINKAFDKVIEEMKTLGIFHEREENQIAAETLHYYITVTKNESSVEFAIYDENFNVTNSAQLSPDVNVRDALKTALEITKDDIAEDMDYAVFEQMKANKIAEIEKASRQQAIAASMNIPVEPVSYEQLSFMDLMQQAKEAANKEVVEDTKTHQEKQFDIIQANNSMKDDIHVEIGSVSDIKTFEEAMKDSESFAHGDFDIDDAKKALKTGMVTVYSSKPIEQGGFVSTSYNMAKDYAGSGRVYAERVNIKDVAWVNGDKGQLAKVPEKEIQKDEPKRGNRETRAADKDLNL